MAQWKVSVQVSILVWRAYILLQKVSALPQSSRGCPLYSSRCLYYYGRSLHYCGGRPYYCGKSLHYCGGADSLPITADGVRTITKGHCTKILRRAYICTTAHAHCDMCYFCRASPDPAESMDLLNLRGSFLQSNIY